MNTQTALQIQVGGVTVTLDGAVHDAIVTAGFEYVMGHKGYVHIRKPECDARKMRERYHLDRFVCGLLAATVAADTVEHLNGDKNDYRRENLKPREVTQ